MIVRPEKIGDEAAIGEVVAAAFGTLQEAELVAKLRGNGDLVLSLVAEVDGRIVGHVAFSRVWIEYNGSRTPGVSLAPVAVRPERQRNGAARALIGAGHLQLRARGESIVFVLGDPNYYKRFGFSHALAAGFACVYQGEHWMALRLAPDAPTAGEVIYAPAFAELE